MAAAGRATGVGSLSSPGSAQRGYTLIEVLVAFSVLALALTLLLGTLSGATRQVRWSADAGRAALHAQSLLAQTGVGEVLQPGRQEGVFDDGRYRWTLVVAPYQDPLRPAPAAIDPFSPQLLQLALEVRWGDGAPAERLSLESLRLVQPAPGQGGVP
jgi:general secretion pathway protein I